MWHNNVLALGLPKFHTGEGIVALAMIGVFVCLFCFVFGGGGGDFSCGFSSHLNKPNHYQMSHHNNEI